jgi:alpha-D-xyloside xylohydrolase
METVKTASGLSAHNDREVLEVTLCSDSLVHVVARPAAAPASKSARPWMLDPARFCLGAAFHFSQSGDVTTMATSRLTIALSASDGSLDFKTSDGERLTRENTNLARTFETGPNQPEGTYLVEDRFLPDATEAIYGLGQHQSGLFNYRGSVVELAQDNTDVSIPLVISSKGYGILWNTASFTYVGNRFPGDLTFQSLAAD